MVYYKNLYYRTYIHQLTHKGRNRRKFFFLKNNNLTTEITRVGTLRVIQTITMTNELKDYRFLFLIIKMEHSMLCSDTHNESFREQRPRVATQASPYLWWQAGRGELITTIKQLTQPQIQPSRFRGALYVSLLQNPTLGTLLDLTQASNLNIFSNEP